MTVKNKNTDKNIDIQTSLYKESKCQLCYDTKKVAISCCTQEVVDEDILMCPVCYEHLGQEPCPRCCNITNIDDDFN